MELASFHFLLTPAGQEALARATALAPTEENHLQIATLLRQELSAEQVHAVLETAFLRQRARVKFSRAAAMYFTRSALEQASAEIVARYRVRRYEAAGFRRIADLGCGIGGDALALATAEPLEKSGIDVLGVDWHPLRLAMAQENVHVYGGAGRFHPLQADLLALSPLPVEALFADPGRRDEHGRRIYSVNKYRPPLNFLDRWRPLVPHQGVKISPGVDYAELPDEAEVEFISVGGEVREAALWFGDLRSAASRRATLLPEGHTLVAKPGPEVAVTRPGSYLYEPDGAVIRAHLVEELARRLGASKIDAQIAYLTSDQAVDTPFARRFAIESTLPFQLKRLRQHLRQLRIGQVTIKKRGSPLDPEMLRRQLRLKGDEARLLFLTRVLGEPTVLIGREIT